MPTGYTGPIYGLEKTHVWNSTLTLNAETVPRIQLDSIVGLQSISELEDIRAPRTEQPGEIVYPSYTRGKTITYTGTVIASSFTALRTLQATIIAAFRERSIEGKMVVGGAYYFTARPISLDMDDEQAASPFSLPTAFQRPFVLSLRLSDPAYYAV